MACKRTNNVFSLKMNVATFILLFITLWPLSNLLAQEKKTAAITLSFSQTDSTKTCKATVLSDSGRVKGTEVHLYVKRSFSLLPVGKVVETDENGEANIDVPMDLPGDKNGMLVIIAKIEKDETYGDAETQSEVKWGAALKNEPFHWGDRSLSASREKAPMFLVVASTSIIVIIWGTIFYVIFQLVRINKSGRLFKKLHGSRS
ncbi:MAG: hypothetical protein Q8941_04485 [Bacteroidota bacterium]|nr:hypothetical protein [Bacteroidota bacterium]